MIKKVVSIVFVTALVLGTVLLFVRASSSGQGSLWPTPTLSPSTPAPSGNRSPDSMSDWKTYTSEKYRYSIKYPPTWYIDPAPVGGLGGSTKISSYDLEKELGRGGPVLSNELKVEVFVLENPSHLDATEWLKENSRFLETGATEPRQTVVIDELTGVRTRTKKGIYSDSSVFVPKGKRMYLIVATPLDSKYLEVFDLMLGSLELIR